MLHAIQEFQDLQFMELGKGPYPNQSNYLFFEGLLTLREAVAAGLNNLFHGSLTLLRRTLEVFLFDAWWKPRLRSDEDWLRFQGWLDETWRPPPFRNIADDVYGSLTFPGCAWNKTDAVDLYAELCNYAHKTLPHKSLARVRGSTRPAHSPHLTEMWLYALHALTAVVLDLLIAECPMSMFPVCVYRKFGFNPPVGIFFDRTNFIPLKRALGTVVTAYKDFYQQHQEVRDLQHWFSAYPNLSNDEVLATWLKEPPLGEGESHSVEKRIELRFTLLKAEIRALSWGFAYASMPDVRNLVKRPRETRVH